MAKKSHKAEANLEKILNLRKYLFEETEFDPSNFQAKEVVYEGAKKTVVTIPRKGGGITNPDAGLLLKGGIGRVTLMEIWGDTKEQYIYKFVSTKFTCITGENTSGKSSEEIRYSFHSDDAPKHGPHVTVLHPSVRLSQNKFENGFDDFLTEVERNFYIGNPPKVEAVTHMLWDSRQ